MSLMKTRRQKQNRKQKRAKQAPPAPAPLGLLLRCPGSEARPCPDRANVGFPLALAGQLAKVLPPAGWTLVKFSGENASGRFAYVEAMCGNCAADLVTKKASPLPDDGRDLARGFVDDGSLLG